MVMIELQVGGGGSKTRWYGGLCGGGGIGREKVEWVVWFC